MSRVVVKLADTWVRKLIGRADAEGLDYDTLERAAKDLSIPGLVRVFDRFGHPSSRPLIQSRSIRKLASAPPNAPACSENETEGLIGFFAIDLGNLEPAEQEQFLRGLQSLHHIVESAAFEPSYRAACTVQSAATPLYRRDQCYLDAIGIDDVPSNGSWYGVGFAEMDVGWNLDHEALRHIGRPRLFPVNMTEIPEDTHGTAVLGVVVGSAKIQGIAQGAAVKALLFPARGWKNIAEQFLDFLDAEQNDALQFGDIVLIELEQEAGPGTPQGLPLEVQPAMFRAIELAVSRGIVVIEAAGNGTKHGSVRKGWNLDEIATGGRHAPAWSRTSTSGDAFPRSAAIMVSGCVPPFPARVGEKYEADVRLNFGSRVDCYGFGSAVVTSGDNFPPPGYDIPVDHNDPSVWYDCGFGMTSAAAAMVTGAALAIQRMAHEEMGRALSPSELRNVLRDPRCGASVRRNGQHVGIVPHLAKIRNLLRMRTFDVA